MGLLPLERHEGESVDLHVPGFAYPFRVEVQSIGSKRVVLRFDAPRTVRILRSELGLLRERRKGRGRE